MEDLACRCVTLGGLISVGNVGYGTNCLIYGNFYEPPVCKEAQMSIEIREGLRKLDFEESADGEKQAVVEFVRSSPLPPSETVRVALGRRDGLLRELVGLPQMLEQKGAGASNSEYRYRVRGTIRATT